MDDFGVIFGSDKMATARSREGAPYPSEYGQVNDAREECLTTIPKNRERVKAAGAEESERVWMTIGLQGGA
jgi:hypothetical protein